jgi:hypothetical protein
MRYAVAALVVICGGCATGPVYQMRPWQQTPEACIQKVTSYTIGVTTEQQFRDDWCPSIAESQAHASALVGGQIVGHLDSSSLRSGDSTISTHWIGYYWTPPYSYHRQVRRVYAVEFVDGKLRSVYSP